MATQVLRFKCGFCDKEMRSQGQRTKHAKVCTK